MTKFSDTWSKAVVTEPFKTWHITDALTLWYNPSRVPEYIISEGLPWNAGIVAKLWGYAIPGGDSFPADRFDLNCPATMYCEAYGGDGGGGNGGGARAGNLRGVQLKGIGPNMYVGVAADRTHSYGALYLEHAVMDTIYSQLVSRLLPLGSVTVFGIIDSGLTIQYSDPEKNYRHNGAGGILVREECLRLGHFLPAQEFRPLQHQRRVMADTQRMRLVMQRIRATGRGDSSIENMLLSFLSNSAKQLAWARASRLKHGALSPSNVGIDGRWLDLSQTTTLPLGVNQRISPNHRPFLQESYAPPTYVLEVMHFYNKYNQRSVTLGGALHHYNICWQRAYREALMVISGMYYPKSATANTASDAWFSSLTRRINGNPLPFTDAVGEGQQDDDFTRIILQSFANINETDPRIELHALEVLIQDDWRQAQAKGSPLNLQQHRRCCMLRAWRRSAYSPLFWRSRIQQTVHDVCQSNAGDVGRMMDDLTAIMDFAFAETPSTEEITLLKLGQIHISWLPVTGNYRLINDCYRQEFSSAEKLADFISGMSTNLVRWHFDFRNVLLVLLTELAPRSTEV